MQRFVQFYGDTIHIPTAVLWYESENCLYIPCVQQGKWNIFKDFFVDNNKYNTSSIGDKCLFYVHVFIFKKWLE